MRKISRRFLFSLGLVVVIVLGTALAIFLAKGYRFSTKTGTLNGTGIISVISIPDQASVYLDGHLTTATNANINSLLPKEYDVKITKDGFIPWEKKITVKEGLVSQIKATLFPAIPTVYPLTYNGVEKTALSPDGTRMFLITPENASDASLSASVSPQLRKSGLWVWNMNTNPLPFAGGQEPHKIASLIPGIDYSQATVRWAPDSSQIIVNLPDRSLRFSSDGYQDTGQDITAILEPTIKSWDDAEKTKLATQMTLIKDMNIRSEASGSAVLNFSLDQTKVLYSKDGKTNFKVADLLTNSVYQIPSAGSLSWLPDSRHLIVVESQAPEASATPSPQDITNLQSKFPTGNISVMEYDGSNKSEIIYDNFNPTSVFPWPDSSRLVIIKSYPTPTANIPNLFGINLK